MIDVLSLEQLKLGTVGNLPYLVKVDKNVNYEMYEPMSYDNWKLFRDLSPGKMGSTYKEYCDLKRKSYTDEIERRKDIEYELKMFQYDTNFTSLNKTKKAILEIENSDLFKEWCGETTIDYKNEILKLL